MKSKYILSTKEILDLMLIILTCIPGKLYKTVSKPIWLISERKDDAQDNGYCFFNYICNHHPNVCAYYVINKKSRQYSKVATLGNTVNWGGVKHHFLFWACSYNLSAHIIEGMPSPRICHKLNKCHIYNFKNVFLQHGVTKDKVFFLSKDQNRIDLFVCVSERECSFVEKSLFYNRGEAVCLGFSRYDSLYNEDRDKNSILIMPTWRSWFDTSSMTEIDFCKTSYFLHYSSLLKSDRLNEICKLHNLKIIFYLHDNFQPFTKCFESNNSHVTIASKDTDSVQMLLKTSSILVTDYSSVFFDFAYMQKPIIYYQFDYEEFRNKHYAEGYFSYNCDGFGPVVYTEAALIDAIQKSQYNNFQMTNTYVTKVKNFFKYNDCNNSQRIFEYISERFA